MKYIGIVLIIIMLISLKLLKKEKFNNKYIIHILNIAKILLIVCLLEITLFNINSYRLLLGNYEKKEYEINSFEEVTKISGRNNVHNRN